VPALSLSFASDECRIEVSEDNILADVFKVGTMMRADASKTDSRHPGPRLSFRVAFPGFSGFCSEANPQKPENAGNPTAPGPPEATVPTEERA